MKRPLRLGVLASGRGSNFKAILDAVGEGRLSAEVAVLIGNAPGSGAIEIAKARGIPSECVTSRTAGGRGRQLETIHRLLLEYSVDLVVLAGFNLILLPKTTKAFANRIINIHPSLLPAFAGGMAPRPQADALKYGVKVSGCTVHVVTDDLDAGPIVAQAAVPVLDQDTPETLAARILEQEHRLLPQVIQWFAEGRVAIDGRRVRILSDPTPDGIGRNAGPTNARAAQRF